MNDAELLERLFAARSELAARLSAVEDRIAAIDRAKAKSLEDERRRVVSAMLDDGKSLKVIQRTVGLSYQRVATIAQELKEARERRAAG